MAKSGKSEEKFPAGLRYSAQRKIIWEVIQNQKDGHLDAEEVFLKARQKLPRLSLSTVYRTLSAFKKNGYLEDFFFDQTHRHFELKQADHLHFICSECGEVKELNTRELGRLKNEVESRLKVTVKKSDFNLIGLCSQCQKTKK